MKILHLTRDFPPKTTGGMSVAVGGLVGALAKVGMQNLVVSFDAWRPKSSGASEELDADLVEGEAGEHPLVRVYRVQQPAQLRPLRERVLAESGWTLVHVHDSLLAECAIEWAAAAGCPWLESLHTCQRTQASLRPSAREALSLRAQRASHAHAGLILAPSQAAAESLKARAPELAAKVRVATVGISDGPTARSARTRREAVARGPLLFVGRHADLKGLDELGQACTQLLAAGRPIELELAGGLPVSPKAQRRWRRRWAERFPELEAYTRHLGWLGSDALSAAFARARLLIAPSWWETFGLAVAEAMCHALPVVASDVGGLRELIVDRERGRLVPPRDASGLAAVISEMLDDPSCAWRMGQRGAEFVLGAYNEGVAVRQHLQAYEELSDSMARRAPRARV